MADDVTTRRGDIERRRIDRDENTRAQYDPPPVTKLERPKPPPAAPKKK